MNRSYRATIGILAVAIVMTWVSAALADTFLRPPETDPLVPPGGWVEPFPYQRNVTLGFDSDPNNWPLKAGISGPNARDLQPPDYRMQGRLDPILFQSDWFGWEGNLVWSDEFKGHHGVIGAIPGSTLNLILHLDNWGMHPVKHIWIEMDAYFRSSTTKWDTSPKYTRIEIDTIFGAPGDFERDIIWIELIPNPLSEDIILSLSPDIKGEIWIDNLHIATESVPLPGTLGLLGVGLAALLSFKGDFRGRLRE